MEREAKVEAYLPLVGAIARALSRGLPSAVEMDDLIHDGVIGLIRAMRRYDPDRGVGFSTYAGHRIRGAMLDGLRERDPLPRSVRRMQKQSDESDPGSRTRGIHFLDLAEALTVPADETSSPEAVVLEADLRRQVRAGLAALPPRDRQVLVLRMVRGLPLRAVAGRLSLSITRTAEIQARGLTRLRRFLEGRPMLRPRRPAPATIPLRPPLRQEERRRAANRMPTSARPPSPGRPRPDTTG
ncbi:MAG: sigma-70 family RNA polymerase sigma factor [Armatimonadota bacterium]|nr:sigma-70 family RNA polymerase sigma factor [Armatimonadota bacterium]MDR7550850.1 sigma-70 family RNA polymerase sigma factor [Armatimonadota bacterium]